MLFRSVLIIDEAQNLSPESLEQVRLLSNFETPTEKLLQILLVGQPELEQRLALPALRQLKQRIALRCRIQPLTPDETAEYIRVRLRIAGARDSALFTPDAVARIRAHAGGIPRIVNALCDHALLIGYADQQRRIDGRIARDAIQYLESGQAADLRPAKSPRRAGRRRPVGATRVPRWAVVGGAVAALIGIVFVPAWTLWPETLHDVMSPVAALAQRLWDLVGR